MGAEKLSATKNLGILAPLRDAPIALLWGGLATSSVGDQLFAVVLSWIAVRQMGADAGYLSAFQAAAGLATSLFVGYWADRLEQRRLMMGADLARALMLFGLVAVWLAIGTPPVWALFVCVPVLAGGQAVFRPALQATVPVLARDVALLPATNALLDTTERIARLLGPGLVGVASAAIPLVHFVTIDAASFLCSGAAILAIARMRPVGPPRAERQTVLASLARGFSTVRRQPILCFVLQTTAILNGTWYAVIFLGLPLLIERSGSGLSSYGLVISAYGSANLLGTLVVGSMGVARRPGMMIFSGNLALAGGMAGFAAAGFWAPPGWLLGCLMACAAASAVGGPMQDITVATLRQTALPLPDMAAAVRAFMVLNQVGILVALVAAPAVFRWVGVPGGIFACAMAMLAVGATGLARHGERG